MPRGGLVSIALLRRRVQSPLHQGRAARHRDAGTVAGMVDRGSGSLIAGAPNGRMWSKWRFVQLRASFDIYRASLFVCVVVPVPDCIRFEEDGIALLKRTSLISDRDH